MRRSASCPASRAAVAGGVARGFQDRGDFHRMVAIVVDDGDAIVGSPEAHDDTRPILNIAISRPAVITTLEARLVVLGLDLFL